MDDIQRVQDCIVYFITDREGRVKIGKSTTEDSAYRRLAALQTGSPCELKMIGLLKGDEGRYHAMFRDDRIRGEWFFLAGDLLAFLKDKFSYDETSEKMDAAKLSLRVVRAMRGAEMRRNRRAKEARDILLSAARYIKRDAAKIINKAGCLFRFFDDISRKTSGRGSAMINDLRNDARDIIGAIKGVEWQEARYYVNQVLYANCQIEMTDQEIDAIMEAAIDAAMFRAERSTSPSPNENEWMEDKSEWLKEEEMMRPYE